MKREEIIALAQKSGFEPIAHDDWVCFTEEIERLVRSVIAIEREACAVTCENLVIFGSEPGLQKATLKDASEAIRTRDQK